MTGFTFGKTSLLHLAHVHPVLVEVATKAISLSTQDFSVDQGCRSVADERKAVASGHSRTMQSYHLIQPDGFGHAVDLVPYVDGKEQWLWDHIYPIVTAMAESAHSFGLLGKIRWGGVWDKRLDSFLGLTDSAIKEQVRLYTIRHAGSDLLDGPHFEYRP